MIITREVEVLLKSLESLKLEEGQIHRAVFLIASAFPKIFKGRSAVGKSAMDLACFLQLAFHLLPASFLIESRLNGVLIPLPNK